MGGNRIKIGQQGFDDNSQKSQIDVKTKQAISEGYSIEDELKIIRNALVAMGCQDKDFLTMNDFISNLIETAKQTKVKLNGVKTITSSTPKTIPKHPDAPINQRVKAKRDEKEQLDKELAEKGAK